MAQRSGKNSVPPLDLTTLNENSIQKQGIQGQGHKSRNGAKTAIGWTRNNNTDGNQDHFYKLPNYNTKNTGVA